MTKIKTVFILLWMLCSYVRTFACECPQQTIQEELSYSKIIFKGELHEEYSSCLKHHSSMDICSYSLRINHIYKNDNVYIKDSILTVAYFNNFNCEFIFSSGIEYLIYADIYLDRLFLRISKCSRTAEVVNAVEDINYLKNIFCE